VCGCGFGLVRIRGSIPSCEQRPPGHAVHVCATGAVAACRLCLCSAARLSKFNQRPRGCHLGCTSTEVDLWQIWRYLFCPPGTPGPPVHPRGDFYQTDFSPLSCSVLRGPALLRPHPSGAPAGLTPAFPLDSMRRRSTQAKITDLPSQASAFELAKKAFEARECDSHEIAARRDENLYLAGDTTGIQPPL
jgi:hypothetical protein